MRGGRGVSGQVEIDGFRRSLQTVGKAGHQTPGWRGLPPSCLEGEAGGGLVLWWTPSPVCDWVWVPLHVVIAGEQSDTVR